MDFIQLEKKWQQVWEEKDAFCAKFDREKKKFFFTVAYPYISGSLHIGHARAAIEGDVLVRYKRMAGHNVLWSLGFHISGTPVIGISAAIAAGDKKKIDLYKSYVRAYVQDESKVGKIVSSFKDPWEIVKFFIPKMKEEYSKLGISFDWRRSFTSGDPEHQALVRWQFRKYKELGYLTRASYPTLFCVKEKQAVAEDDIVDADINPVEKQEMVLLKFKFNNAFIVAGTMRPETIFGQTNLWVNPDVEYVKTKVDNELWIISRKCAEKLNALGRDVEIIEKINGDELIGKSVFAPGVEKEIPILPCSFADPDRGTGFVTSVPSDAPYDWMAIKDLQSKGLAKEIKPIPIIKTELNELSAIKVCEQMRIKDQNDPKLEEATKLVYKIGYHTGIMNQNCGKYAGLPVHVAKERVKEDLIKSGKADMMYETSRKAICRCGGEVIVALIKDQWFLDFNAPGWKKNAYECLKRIEIIPHVFRKQFEDTFEWLDKRPCTRRRGLGTEFPFEHGWIIESLSDSTIYMSLYPIIHRIRSAGISRKLTDSFFDYVMLGRGDVKSVSKEIGLSKDVLESIRQEFNYWYPNDHRHTFMAHISNHLSFFIFAHAAIFPPEKWPKKISIHGLLLSEGTKMSKSKGNVITIHEVTKKYGADLLRAYMVSSVTIDAAFNWTEHDVKALQRNLKNNFELLSFVVKERGKSKLSYAGKSFISFFERSVKSATRFLNEMKLREYAKVVLFDLPNAYRKLRSRASKDELKAVNDTVAERWLKLISPLLPHTAEELWSMLGKRNLVSLESWPKHIESNIDPVAEASEELISHVLHDIDHIRKITGISEPRKITIFVSPPWKYELYNMLVEGRGPKEIMKRFSSKEASDYLKRLMKRKPLDELFLTAGHELKALEEAKQFIAREYDCEVHIIESEKSTNPRARYAEPGKPGILLE